MGKIPTSTTMALTTSIKAMLASMPIPQDKIDAALTALFDTLNGKDIHSITNSNPLGRVLTPKQTATLLHRSERTVRDMADRGLLRRVYCGAKGKRCAGHAEESVRAFLTGKEIAR